MEENLTSLKNTTSVIMNTIFILSMFMFLEFEKITYMEFTENLILLFLMNIFVQLLNLTNEIKKLNNK